MHRSIRNRIKQDTAEFIALNKKTATEPRRFALTAAMLQIEICTTGA
jgi:hypothetical protein